jgi:hypothetical protein
MSALHHGQRRAAAPLGTYQEEESMKHEQTAYKRMFLGAGRLPGLERRAGSVGMLAVALLLMMLVWTSASAQEHRPNVQAEVPGTVTAPVLPPAHESIDPFLATPAAGSTYVIPVVIIRFLPTADGVNLDVSMAPDFYTLGEISLSDLKRHIDTFDKRIKFMLEEGSRFRGHRDPAAPPSIGYEIVAYITVYEQTPPGPVFYSSQGFPVFGPDMHQIFERFNAELYVNTLGVKEFWIWQGGLDASFPSYDPNIHHPENFRTGFESNMSSPLTGDISNSSRDNSDLPVYERTYTVYEYNFRRSQAEAVHNHGHQLEAILSYANQRQDGNTDLFWKQFVGQDVQGNFITGRCGWTHMPPNTTQHYDYLNTTPVLSDCEDWTPDHTGATTLVNVDTWGNLAYAWPDGETDFPQKVESQWYIYWMQNMPGAGNTIRHGQGYMTNWWAFTGDWDASISAGLGLHEPTPQQPPVNFPDFNGDGFADLAMGVPGEDLGNVANAGAVHVLYGSPTRLTAAGNQLWQQDSPDIRNTNEADDAFGSALSMGDFNGDGFTDLAIGIPGEDVGSVSNAGAVIVLYGSTHGLTAAGNQFWSQNSTDVEDTAEAGDAFGSALITGDFNGDGFADLAIGVPGESVGSASGAGAVNVLYGSAGGLSAAGDQLWHQNSTDIEETAQSQDAFGRFLAVGDFNGDGFTDLAIAAPGESVGSISRGGAVNVLYGGPSKLSATGDQLWHQNSMDVEDTAEAEDAFGSALMTGDFNGDGFADLAIGARKEDVGSITDAGAVNVLYGTSSRLGATGDQLWHQNSAGIENAGEAGDFFGN